MNKKLSFYLIKPNTMKNLKTNLFSSLLTATILLGMLTFSACTSDDEDDPCSAIECLNGGEKISGTDGCLCDCPAGYTGLNCENKVMECPGMECPSGKSPNPDNSCACE
jgi:hypothetical protein